MQGQYLLEVTKQNHQFFIWKENKAEKEQNGREKRERQRFFLNLNQTIHSLEWSKSVEGIMGYILSNTSVEPDKTKLTKKQNGFFYTKEDKVR